MNATLRQPSKNPLREIALEYARRFQRHAQAAESGNRDSIDHWLSRMQDMEQNIEVRELNGSWR